MLINLQKDRNHWLDEISAAFNAEKVDNQVLVPEDIGQGSIVEYQINKDVTLRIFEICTKHDLEVQRTAKKVSTDTHILFNSTDYDIEIGKDSETQLKRREVSLFTSNTDLYFRFPKDERITSFIIVVSNSWLMDKMIGLRSKHERFNEVISNNEAVFVSLPFNATYDLPLSQVRNYNLSKELKDLYLYSKITELISLFYYSIQNELLEHGPSFLKLHKNDLKSIQLVLNYIEKNLDKNISIDDLCKIGGYSKSKLQRLMKATVGHSVYSYVLNVRIEQAKQLLLNPNYSISDISYSLGFSSPAHFSLRFSKAVGITPKKFRSNSQSL